MKAIYTIILISILAINTSQAQSQLSFQEETCTVEKVFPNPAKEYVFVEIKLEEFAKVQFELIDILGNKVQQWKVLQLFPGNQRVKLQFKAIQTGIYLLKIRVNGKDFVKRIRKS